MKILLLLSFSQGLPLIFYGAKRIRTADPLNAIEVLYQLSYNPVQRFPSCLIN